ncbi:MAG TPA: MarR family transcriptional regulator [Candidatus Dormibacteraeota bacterium]
MRPDEGRQPGPTPPRRRAPVGNRAARDLSDNVTSAWQEVLPELDRAALELVTRTVRLESMLEDTLNACLRPWKLTRADFSVLTTLRAAGPPYELQPGDLTARNLLTSGGVSNILTRLKSRGFIERERDPLDGRSAWVRLTPSGTETAESIMRAWDDAQADFFRAVPPDVTRTAADALRATLLAMGDYEPAPAHVRERRATPRLKPPGF